MRSPPFLRSSLCVRGEQRELRRFEDKTRRFTTPGRPRELHASPRETVQQPRRLMHEILAGDSAERDRPHRACGHFSRQRNTEIPVATIEFSRLETIEFPCSSQQTHRSDKSKLDQIPRYFAGRISSLCPRRRIVRTPGLSCAPRMRHRCASFDITTGGEARMRMHMDAGQNKASSLVGASATSTRADGKGRSRSLVRATRKQHPARPRWQRVRAVASHGCTRPSRGNFFVVAVRFLP